jgi:predicted transcriptional regulator
VVFAAGEHYRFPMAISLRLPDDVERRLEETAARLNVPAADLAAAAIRDLLARPAVDFEDAAKRVMEKNEELYGRLA